VVIYDHDIEPLGSIK